jgi:redox-sensitive bicupin YhaK (pirin superfamily)
MTIIAGTWQGKTAPVGDFSVRRLLPKRERRTVGPFCFLDHMGPRSFVGSAGAGVPPHPHIGLSTVTYLFDGQFLHRDSLGTEQIIVPGDVNWMTAGVGIVHSERFPPALHGRQATLEGLQLWVGLPRTLEESAPSFQHADRSALPAVVERGTSLRVVLGEWEGARAPVALASPTFFVVAELEPGAALALSARHPERAVYVVRGEVALAGTTIAAGTLAVLTPGLEDRLVATQPTRLAVLGGEPLDGPRFMNWNFVSSRRERLETAWEDWLGGRFAQIAGDPSMPRRMP